MPEKYLKDISIIIATCNRSSSLRNVLTDLAGLKDCESITYEIIVVDNNSKDQTREVVEEFQKKMPGKIVYMFEPRQGRSIALNLGIEQAKGKILAFTDDDVKVDPHWIKNVKEGFEKYSCDMIGGRILPYYYPDTPQWLKDNSHQLFGPIVQCDYGSEDKPYDCVKMREFVGANIAFKKSVLDECGGFRVDIGAGQGLNGEDTEMFQRLYQRKKQLYYCGSVLIWHPVEKNRANLRYLAGWFMRTGRFRVRIGTFDNEPLVHWGGVPRYLFRAIPVEMVQMLLNFYDRGKFLKFFSRFFIMIGGAKEYRLLYKKSENS
ncbi:MAG: glycosyltransferase family 2 protein [Candidatus Omnitrophica bacterium]|nr:glycosyltransferase family 2 protein [Candidatus Omnitrophota bacterium]